MKRINLAVIFHFVIVFANFIFDPPPPTHAVIFLALGKQNCLTNNGKLCGNNASSSVYEYDFIPFWFSTFVGEFL